MTTRRTFLTRMAGALATATIAPHRWLSAADRARDRVKITDIDRYEVYLPHYDFNGRDLFRYHCYGIQANTILLV